MPSFDPGDLRSLEDVMWLALGDSTHPRRALLSRLLASPEFHTVRIAYECLLGRPADESDRYRRTFRNPSA